jgi:hypothetical protein
MIIFLLIIGLIVLLGLDAAAFILIQRLLGKISTYETWILEFKQDVINTLAWMRAIDIRGDFAARLNDEGVFESDDQVGQTFKELLDLIEKLNKRAE